MFVVWEPVLPTDWARPGSSILARAHDPRARQYWDAEHIVSGLLQQKLRTDSSHPQPTCCDDEGILWDLTAVYPAGARWEAELPRASYVDGPVWKLKEQIKAALAPAKQ